MNPELDRYRLILIKIAIVLTALVTIYFFCAYFFPEVFKIAALLVWGLIPFILALVMAILIDPIVDYLSGKRRMNRGLAVGITLCVLFVLIVLVVLFFTSRIVIELTKLYASLPDYAQYIAAYSLNLVEQLRIFLTNNPLPAEATEALSANLQAIVRKLTDFAATSTNFLLGLITGLPAFFTIIIVAGVATFFISRDKALIAGALYSYMPKKYIRSTSQVIGEINAALVGFFRAQTILISITAILSIAGLYILKIDYALTIGLIIGFFDLLPILGPGTILVPWAIIVLLLGNYALCIALLVLYVVLIGVRQLIEPKILSENIGLHPLAILVSLYLGLRFIGVWGIILGPFLLILVKAVVKSRIQPR
ncbi:MAG: sporulation integral membrane protein YtvI [Clostridia bacterium]|jgi:sporulation integral membrane protein YtvI|nr:sporulation integral membrane protein YtvI [Clostridia bacterium]